MTSPLDLAALRAVLAKASPGPWYAGRRHISTNNGKGLGTNLPGSTLSNHTEPDDAAAIVAIMNAAGPLLREVEAARKVVEHFRRAYESPNKDVVYLEYKEARACIDALAAYDAATEGGG